MKTKKLKPEVKAVWERLNRSDILNDTLVRNEFYKRGMKLKDAGTVMLVFSVSGKVHVHGQLSTESHSPEIAIMKSMIKDNILDNESNYE